MIIDRVLVIPYERARKVYTWCTPSVYHIHIRKIFEKDNRLFLRRQTQNVGPTNSYQVLYSTSRPLDKVIHYFWLNSIGGTIGTKSFCSQNLPTLPHNLVCFFSLSSLVHSIAPAIPRRLEEQLIFHYYH